MSLQGILRTCTWSYWTCSTCWYSHLRLAHGCTCTSPHPRCSLVCTGRRYFSVTTGLSDCSDRKGYQKPNSRVDMLSQQLALQCPSHYHPFKRATWKCPYHLTPSPTVSQTVVSAGAEVARKRAGPMPTRHVIENSSVAQKPAAPRDVGASNKFLEVYILGKHIGSGAYGQVQLVVERATGQCAAVKLLPKIRGKLSKVLLASCLRYLSSTHALSQAAKQFQPSESYWICRRRQ